MLQVIFIFHNHQTLIRLYLFLLFKLFNFGNFLLFWLGSSGVIWWFWEHLLLFIRLRRLRFLSVLYWIFKSIYNFYSRLLFNLPVRLFDFKFFLNLICLFNYFSRFTDLSWSSINLFINYVLLFLCFNFIFLNFFYDTAFNKHFNGLCCNFLFY